MFFMPEATIPSSIGWAVTMTLLTSVLDVKFRAKSGISSTFTSHFAAFAILQVIGNAITALGAIYLVHDKLPEGLQWYAPFIYAFVGVFAFEGVLSNMNISLFDTKILKFQEWVGIARDPAVASAIAKEARLNTTTRTKLANQLKTLCPPTDIDTHLRVKLGETEWLKIEQATYADTLLYKCLRLAEEDENNAKALVRHYKKLV